MGDNSQSDGQSPQKNTLILSGSATIRDISTIYAQMKDALDTTENLKVDCSALTETDFSFVQILAAARKTAEGRGQTLSLETPLSPVLCAALKRSGVVPDTFFAYGEA